MYKWIYFTSRVLPLQFFTGSQSRIRGIQVVLEGVPSKTEHDSIHRKWNTTTRFSHTFFEKKNPQKNSNQLVDPGTKPYPRTLMWKRPRTTAVEQHVPISLSLEIFSFSDKPLSQVAKHNWRSEALSEDKANICQSLRKCFNVSYPTDIEQK